ncbi:hypothetical protein GCM10009745_68870 [Kribbella yunnanensis]|uniref:PE domain-containing protein n=2 Tax=Kribbella yunnanensis TaxID=190194 RepID=A0ABN2IT92_9ACTN
MKAARWRLFRRRRSREETDHGPETKVVADKAAKTQPEMKPGRAKRRPNETAMKGDNKMPNAPIAQAVDAVQAITAWEPESINDVDEFLTDLGDLYEALATTQANLAQRFGSDLPIGAPVVDHLSELASGAAALTDHAHQGRSIFRSFHEAEFERLENPRPNEEMWDVRANR